MKYFVADTLEWKPQRINWTAQRRSSSRYPVYPFKFHETNQKKFILFTSNIFHSTAMYEMVRVMDYTLGPLENGKGLFNYLQDQVKLVAINFN